MTSYLEAEQVEEIIGKINSNDDITSDDLENIANYNPEFNTDSNDNEVELNSVVELIVSNLNTDNLSTEETNDTKIITAVAKNTTLIKGLEKNTSATAEDKTTILRTVAAKAVEDETVTQTILADITVSKELRREVAAREAQKLIADVSTSDEIKSITVKASNLGLNLILKEDVVVEENEDIEVVAVPVPVDETTPIKITTSETTKQFLPITENGTYEIDGLTFNVTNNTTSLGRTYQLNGETFLSGDIITRNNKTYILGSIFIIPLAQFIPCVTGESMILTPSGEKQIKYLKEGDLVVTPNGEHVPIVKVMKKYGYSQKQMPWIIPAHFYQENYPKYDTYISGNHAYQIEFNQNHWCFPRLQGSFRQMEGEKVCYYNLKLPNYHKHQFICNGLALESWNENPSEVQQYRWAKIGKNYKKIMV